MEHLLSKLETTRLLTEEEFLTLLSCREQDFLSKLYQKAVTVQQAHYGNNIYVRGLIEFTNHCKNDCLYCGIRRSNVSAARYRLTPEEILSCCEEGYELGYRTFVLQGGEDPYYSSDKIASLVEKIKNSFPDCAVTLSVGEQTRDTYQLWFDAGADRYLLRHETADSTHYSSLHPRAMTLENRIRCLYDLKEIGYQVGCGMMVGSPGQTLQHLIKDLLFLHEFQPDMVGIGPFIPHCDTPFKEQPAGTLEQTRMLLAIIRLMLPDVLLPATTALGTIHPEGRELGILAGANVCMPNLSPKNVREKYMLYNKKAFTGAEAAEGKTDLEKRLASIGYQIVIDRGDRRCFYTDKKERN